MKKADDLYERKEIILTVFTNILYRTYSNLRPAGSLYLTLDSVITL